MNTGVYCWYNTLNGKRYVGSAAHSFDHRRYRHVYRLRRNKSHCPHLQSAWLKYGQAVFEFQILKRCQPEKCVAWEQYYILHYKSYKREFGYNSDPVAGSSLGRKCSEEHRRRLSEAQKGRVPSEEARRRMSEVQKGKKRGPYSLEHKRKISEAKSGKSQGPHSEETRRKISKAHKGKVHSEETKRKISEAHRNRSRVKTGWLFPVLSKPVEVN